MRRQISELKICANFNVAGKRNSRLSVTACCAYARRIIIDEILPDCFLMKVPVCAVIIRSTQSDFKALTDRTVLNSDRVNRYRNVYGNFLFLPEGLRLNISFDGPEIIFRA